MWPRAQRWLSGRPWKFSELSLGLSWTKQKHITLPPKCPHQGQKFSSLLRTFPTTTLKLQIEDQISTEEQLVQVLEQGERCGKSIGSWQGPWSSLYIIHSSYLDFDVHLWCQLSYLHTAVISVFEPQGIILNLFLAAWTFRKHTPCELTCPFCSFLPSFVSTL